jgi:copper chaperone NosL
MKNGLFTIGLLFIFLIGCTPEAKEINYGSDMCHYCKMTVVDNQHAAELVTKKGKAFMFDAIECMVNYTEENKETEYAFLLVNDYNNPGKLIPATESYFLQSQAIPSPMGAFLSAFENEAGAESMKTEKGGEVYQWEELNKLLKGKE